MSEYEKNKNKNNRKKLNWKKQTNKHKKTKQNKKTQTKQNKTQKHKNKQTNTKTPTKTYRVRQELRASGAGHRGNGQQQYLLNGTRAGMQQLHELAHQRVQVRQDGLACIAIKSNR